MDQERVKWMIFTGWSVKILFTAFNCGIDERKGICCKSVTSVHLAKRPHCQLSLLAAACGFV